MIMQDAWIELDILEAVWRTPISFFHLLYTYASKNYIIQTLH